MVGKINTKLKLSEFRHHLKTIWALCKGDPTLEFEINGSKIQATGITLTTDACDVPTERGILSPMPNPHETLLIQLEDSNG
jgi:hypothetical protein